MDSRELTCKLSGLELGSGRSNDSGVASPSDTGDTETQETKGGTKSRTESGEDAGIGGSEQGNVMIIMNKLLHSSCHTLDNTLAFPPTIPLSPVLVK